MGNVPGVVLVVLAALGATCGTSRGGLDLRPALTTTRGPNHAMSRAARVMPSCWLLAEGYHALAGLDGAGCMPQLRLGARPNLQLRGGGVAESDGSDSDGDQGGSSGEGGMSDGRGSGGSDKVDSDSASDAHVSGAGDAGSDAVTGEGGGKGGSSGLFVPPPPMHPDAEQDAAQFKPGMTRDMQVCKSILAGVVIHDSRLPTFHAEAWMVALCAAVSPWPHALLNNPPYPSSRRSTSETSLSSIHPFRGCPVAPAAHMPFLQWPHHFQLRWSVERSTKTQFFSDGLRVRNVQVKTQLRMQSASNLAHEMPSRYLPAPHDVHCSATLSLTEQIPSPVSVCLDSPIWRDQSLFRSNVDGHLPHTSMSWHEQSAIPTATEPGFSCLASRMRRFCKNRILPPPHRQHPYCPPPSADGRAYVKGESNQNVLTMNFPTQHVLYQLHQRIRVLNFIATKFLI